MATSPKKPQKARKKATTIKSAATASTTPKNPATGVSKKESATKIPTEPVPAAFKKTPPPQTEAPSAKTTPSVVELSDTPQSSRGPLFAVIIWMLVIAISGFAFFRYSAAAGHEEIFADMLEHSLSKTSAQLVYRSDLTGGLVSESTYRIDYSDISNVLLSGQTDITVGGGSLTYQTEVVYDGEFVYLKFNSYELRGESILRDDVIGKWVQLDPAKSFELEGLDFGAVQSTPLIASPLGEVPDGYFSPEQRAELLQLMEIGKTYVIENSTETIIDGTDYIEYEVEHDGERLNQLNERVSELAYGDRNQGRNLFDDETFTVIVDKDTHQFHQAITDGGELIMDHYDEPVEITAPSEFILPGEFLDGVDFKLFDSFQPLELPQSQTT